MLAYQRVIGYIWAWAMPKLEVDMVESHCIDKFPEIFWFVCKWDIPKFDQIWWSIIIFVV